MNQPEGPAAADELAIEAWLVEFSAQLPADLLGEVGGAEREALLDLARVAARRSHRKAAPITTYLLGLAMATLPNSERLARMRTLAAKFDSGA